MKKFILGLVLLTVVKTNAQNLTWANQIGGTGNDIGYAIAVDASDNVYTTGVFTGTVDFDPGTGVTNLIANASDIFISKTDASGNFIWAKSIGGSLNDQGNSITVDNSGNVFTTGYFQGTVDFDPGAGVSNLSASAGYSGIFISKLDASGNFVWAKYIGGPSGALQEGKSIALDATGSVYITGTFAGLVDFDPNAGTFTLTSSGGSDDIFISKLDVSGNFIWAKSIGAGSTDRGAAISIDGLGNVFITGSFNGTVDFDPSASITNLVSIGTSGFSDIFVAKFNSAGNLSFAKNMGGSNAEQGTGITLDVTGNVYCTGFFNGTVDFDPSAASYNLSSNGGNDIFISKLSATGNFIWAKSIGGNGSDVGYSISVDASNNVYTTGYFQITADFDPNASTSTLTSSGNSPDIFISKLDGLGNFISAKSMGANGSDFGYAIKVANNNIHTTGYFSLSVDFDPNAGALVFSSAGGNDIFIHKMNQIITGVSKISIDSGTNIYPNPTTGEFTFESKAETQIVILNALGQVIKTENTVIGITLISLYEQPAGIYFLKFEQNNQLKSIKISKQ